LQNLSILEIGEQPGDSFPRSTDPLGDLLVCKRRRVERIRVGEGVLLPGSTSEAATVVSRREMLSTARYASSVLNVF
jgi:hypothetical protein